MNSVNDEVKKLSHPNRAAPVHINSGPFWIGRYLLDGIIERENEFIGGCSAALQVPFDRLDDLRCRCRMEVKNPSCHVVLLA